jgi:hypothetical protein
MIDSIRIDVSFIGQGDNKRASRIIDDLQEMHIKDFMKALDDFLGGYVDCITTPGTSEA